MKYNTPYIFLVIIIFYTWFITAGNLQLFKLEDYGENTYCHLNGVAYDSLAKSFLKGKVTVESSTILWEAFIRNGEVYTYFGPFPALIRIIPNLISSSMYGRWSKISCLLASMLSLTAFILITYKSLLRNEHLSLEYKKFFFYLSTLAFGLGSPLLFLMTQNHIYHESILWALAWSLLSIYFINLILFKEGDFKFNLLALSFCCGAALLSKFTFGVSVYIILILIIINQINTFNKENTNNPFKRRDFIKYLLKFSLLILPAIIALSFQFWYNYERFGSAFKFLDHRYYSSDWDPLNVPNYKKIATNLFSIDRFPTALYNYLGIGAKYFSNKPPYARLEYVRVLKKGIFLEDQDSKVMTLLIASPWLIFGAISVLFWLINKQEMVLHKVYATILFINPLGILGAHAITHRYQSESMPFLVFMYSLYLLELREKYFFNLNIKKVFILTVLMCTFSIAVTILSSLEWASWHKPDREYRAKIENIYRLIDNSLSSLFTTKKKQN